MKKILSFIALVLFTTLSFGQVGIGTTTPAPSSILDLTATNKAFLLPRVANTAAITTPVNGMIIYDLSTQCIKFYENNAWSSCISAGTGFGGTVATINCAGATNNGTLTGDVVADGVNSVISYTGGNGGTHSGQTVASTGVTGLTATLTAGSFSSGAGTLTYTITGTPSSSGTASFALNIGGQTCTLDRTVAVGAGVIATINCAGATNNGTLTGGVAASGVNSVIPYTGGNGGSHSGQTVASTNVTGLTATLTAGSFASGAGTLTYTITGTPAVAGGTASFAINIAGQTCTLTRTVAVGAGTIATINCAGATNNGTLSEGVAASGVNSQISYTGGNGGTHSGQTVASTGVTGLIATLTAGTFASGAGTLTYTITGTPATSGTANFAINIGGQTCTLARTVSNVITGLTCGSATASPSVYTLNIAYTGTITVPYTGGNGTSYPAGSPIASTGITGFSATLQAGTLANGSGNLTLNVTGSSSTPGVASFAFTFGGQSCTVTLLGCQNDISVGTGAIVSMLYDYNGDGIAECAWCAREVTTAGETWLDRNLGAYRVATLSNDAESYGDLYQWGRRMDGHQKRVQRSGQTAEEGNATQGAFVNSIWLDANNTSDTPNDVRFIEGDDTPGTQNNDWVDNNNNNRWATGANDPCPTGFRVPTNTELQALDDSFSPNTAAGAFSSPVKMPVSAGRFEQTGNLFSAGFGLYWSSTVNATNSTNMNFGNVGSSAGNTNVRAKAFAVRCVKN